MELKFIPLLVKRFVFFIFFTNKFISFFYWLYSLNIIFLRVNSKLKYSTLARFDIILYGLLKGYKVYLEIHSKNYKLRLIDSIKKFGLILRIGYSHLFFVTLVNNFRLHLLSKTLLCLYSSQLCFLKKKLFFFSLKKKRTMYKKKGIFWKNQILTLKKNKKLKF